MYTTMKIKEKEGRKGTICSCLEQMFIILSFLKQCERDKVPLYSFSSENEKNLICVFSVCSHKNRTCCGKWLHFLVCQDFQSMFSHSLILKVCFCVATNRTHKRTTCKSFLFLCVNIHGFLMCRV